MQESVRKREVIRTPEFCKKAEELLKELGSYQSVAEQLRVPIYHVRKAITEGPFVPVALRRRKLEGVTK